MTSLSIRRLSALILFVLASWCSAFAAPVITAPLTGDGPATARVGETMLFTGTGLGGGSLSVRFSDGSGGFVTASTVFVDAARGVFGAKVPAGAATGNMKITVGGADSNLYHFRVDPSSFTQGPDVLSGQIKSALNNQPVANAGIFLFAGGLCGNVAGHDFAMTDPNGRYTVHGTDGTYLVFIFPPSGSGLGVIGLQATLSSTPATLDVNVTSGTPVTGRVVEAGTTNPIANARIAMDSLTVLSHDETVTDPNGVFNLSVLSGQWQIEIMPPPGNAHAQMRSSVFVNAPATDLGDQQLRTGVLVSGTIKRGSDDSPLAGVRIRAFQTDPNFQENDERFSAGDGSYLLVVDPNATYTIESEMSDRSPVANVHIQDFMVGGTNATLNILAQDAAIISGKLKLTGTNAPLDCVRVEARPSDPNQFFFFVSRSSFDGTYRMRVDPSATGYIVNTSSVDDQSGNSPYAFQYWNNTAAGTYFGCEAVAVAAPTAGSTTANVDFTLPLSATLEGTLSSDVGGCMDDLFFLASQLQVDDGTSHMCSMGSFDYNHHGPGYRWIGLPSTSVASPSIRVCAGFDPSTYSPVCYDAKTPPAFDPIVVAGGATQTGVDLCLSSCTQQTWYIDGDQDGYGDINNSLEACNQPPGYVSDASDCDDSNNSVHPGVIENCNGADDDCDGTADDFPTQCGIGACASTGSCVAGMDTCAAGTPTAETCNNLDDNCNGVVDDNVTGAGQPCAVPGLQGVCANGQSVCQAGGLLVCNQVNFPSAELCDNEDNNCDGTVDGFATSCGMGACASAGTCNLGVDTCTPGTPTAESCNSADDDCDGQVDEGDPGGGGFCSTGQAGVCAAGTFHCQMGTLACSRNVNPSAEICDNLDNDCDGNVDGMATSCGVGACAATGSCVAGASTCVPGAPGVETCNGSDDDCDGTVDDVTPTPTSCGVGACASTGTTTCVGGTPGNSCVPGSPSTETCNNADDDCDGTVDDVTPAPTTCGVGACASTGTTTCVGGTPGSTCTPGSPSAETCNNVDDDCDTQTDEGNPGSGAACTVAGKQGVCAQGSTTCQGGGLVCSQVNQPSAETCNNLDDDCDGTVDGFATACGVGACSRTGTCTAGVNSCTPGAPTAETCNNIDDDCNGTIDGFATSCGVGACSRAGTCTAGVNSCAPGAPSAETCNNIDDDCNGTIDGFATTCGVGACGATGTCTAGANICTPGAPSAEICNGADDDCDGQTDDVAGGCTLAVMSPANGSVVNCSPGAPPPAITWSAGSYDVYKVYVSWDPNFAGTKKFTSGDTWLKTTSWTMTAKKWAKACTNANPSIYIKIQGQDKDVPKSDPNRKIFGPIAVVTPN